MWLSEGVGRGDKQTDFKVSDMETRMNETESLFARKNTGCTLTLSVIVGGK